MVIEAFCPAENRWTICLWNSTPLQLVGTTSCLPRIYRRAATRELRQERGQQAAKISAGKRHFINDVFPNRAEPGVCRPRLEHTVKLPGRTGSQIAQRLFVCGR